MRARTRLISGLFLVISSLMSFSLLWSTTYARQEPGDASDQQVAVSRKTLRTIASELMLVRDSLGGDIKRLESDYLRARQNGAKEGDPKEKSIRGDLERQRKIFNQVVDQTKQLQLLAEGK